MSKKLFVSIPMQGQSIDILGPKMLDYTDRVGKVLGESYDLINTLWEEPEPETTNHHTYYLGKSITALAQADLVVFVPGWSFAKGCVIEYEICRLYGIPYYILKDSDDES